MTPPEVESLQSRIRDRVRAEVAEAAVGLFLDRGFDETTVDEICAVAGLSRRSFFRYFQGKEDVVVSEFTAQAELGCAAYLARPSGEDMWLALRNSMIPLTDWVENDRARALALFRLVDASPVLRASYLSRVDRWRASLTAVISAEVGVVSDDGLRIDLISSASVGAYLAVTRAWVRSEGVDSMGALFDDAFAVLRPDVSLS